MTAPQAPPAPGPLARYQRALPRLAVMLRGADLPAGPDRWQNLYDLLLALNARGRLPVRIADLEPLIAPLLCRSAQEQRQFGELFARWVADLEPALRGVKDEAAAAPVLEAQPKPPPLPRLRGWLMGLVLLLAAIAGGVYWYHYSHQPQPIEETARSPESPPLPVPPSPPVTPETLALPLQPVTPRTPREQPTLDPVHRAWLQTLGDLLLLLPGFLALGWLLVRWLTWKTVLERRQGDPDDPLTHIGLDARDDDLLDATDLRQTLKRLHTPIALPTRRLDANATVTRTARHAGLIQPVHRDRRCVPEVVVLLEQRHTGDQMAGLAGQFVDRLRQAGLSLHLYAYRDSPRRLVGGDGRWRPLAEVAGRYEGARLLLIGEPAALIEPFSGEPLPWIDALAPWPARGLLVTRRPPARWQPALAAAGFVVAELDSAGIQTVVLRLSDQPSAPDLPRAALTEPLPRRLQDARRWSQPVAPARVDQDELLATLDAFLGADGTRLLTAMAVYPQLHWGLTRLLDRRLAPEPDGAARERRLLKVARLPWSRAGWLPDWLRSALLERLDSGAERALRRLYRELLDPDTQVAAGRSALPVALPRTLGLWAALRHWLRRRGWRLERWLAASRTLSAAHGALNDAIFADVLFGWRLRLLDFVLPRPLLRRHLGGTLRRALLTRAFLAALIALGGAWVAAHAWQGWGRAVAEKRLLAMQNAAHSDYRVIIWQREETGALARDFNAVLEADGFLPEIAETVLVLPEGKAGPLPSVNKIQWGDEADVRIALHIKERLGYLTWGHDPEVTSKLSTLAALPDLAEPPGGGELRVLLLTPGRTGSAFRDRLENALTPEQIAELVAPPAPAEPEASQPPEPPSETAVDETPPRSPAVEPQPEPETPEPSRPTEPPRTADAGVADSLRSRIAALDKRWAELREEMEREEQGLDGRIASWGPKWRSLDAELQGVMIERRELAAQVLQLQGQTFRDPLKGGGEGPEMVRLPGGRFLMGSPDDEPRRDSDEGPRHRVTVQAFAISRTEVSFADYDRFAEATGRNKPNDRGWGRGERPVIYVDWNDVQAYAQWLSQQTGQRYRLPTEAEWEYAARADTESPFWTGACIHTDQANYNGRFHYNDCGPQTGLYRAQTVPTGSLPANPFGLHEVAGNVWEWVEDCWHDDYEGAPVDGSAWLETNSGDCARRVLRGGGWFDYPWFLRSATRLRFPADEANFFVGIRLARTP